MTSQKKKKKICERVTRIFGNLKIDFSVNKPSHLGFFFLEKVKIYMISQNP